MDLQSFTYSPTEMAGQLTGASHDTLAWLAKNKYITAEQLNELEERLIVVAVPNKKNFGRRLLNKMFGADNKEENAWCFPIVELSSHYAPADGNNTRPTAKKKPTLKVVD